MVVEASNDTDLPGKSNHQLFVSSYWRFAYMRNLNKASKPAIWQYEFCTAISRGKVSKYDYGLTFRYLGDGSATPLYTLKGIGLGLYGRQYLFPKRDSLVLINNFNLLNNCVNNIFFGGSVEGTNIYLNSHQQQMVSNRKFNNLLLTPFVGSHWRFARWFQVELKASTGYYLGVNAFQHEYSPVFFLLWTDIVFIINNKQKGHDKF
ncbi:hypothetical protein GC194_05330 [bacterium]|nr:hypothetical protein [bacterium]